MSKNIITSSFNRLPKGLLVLAALFILTEAFVYANRAELVKYYWNKFIINEHFLLESGRSDDFLIMGDSIQKTGIRTTELGAHVLNLGLPGGKPMSLYLLLDRYLKRHNPPKVIFLYVDPEDPLDSLNVILRYFVSFPEFRLIWQDLTLTEKQIFLMRYFPTLDLRKVGLTPAVEYSGSNAAFVNDMQKGRGYMPAPRPDAVLKEDFFQKNTFRRQDNISMTVRDMKYLDRFMALAASKNIKVVFLGFLVPNELYDMLEKSGFNKAYREFYTGLAVRYPSSNLVKDPIYRMGSKYFADPSHLNNAGSAAYTKYFKYDIFAPAAASMRAKKAEAK